MANNNYIFVARETLAEMVQNLYLLIQKLYPIMCKVQAWLGHCLSRKVIPRSISRQEYSVWTKTRKGGRKTGNTRKVWVEIQERSWGLRGGRDWEGGPHCKDKIPKFRNKYSPKRNMGVSVPISTFMRLWVIYIFPRLVCLFCWRKYVDCRPILGLNKSLTDTWMWTFALRQRYSQKRNT